MKIQQASMALSRVSIVPFRAISKIELSQISETGFTHIHGCDLPFFKRFYTRCLYPLILFNHSVDLKTKTIRAHR